jgi:hypothetical protein
MIPARGAPFHQLRVVRTRAGGPSVSGASAMFRGFRPAALTTVTARGAIVTTKGQD